MDTAGLQDFQRLFVQAIKNPDSSQTPSGLRDRITPGGTLTDHTALGVYQSGYQVRLTEALGETFEAVWWVTGDTNFFRLAKDYLILHPSSSYNLSDFGETFPAFLEKLHPFTDLPFLADLARFEWLFKEVFHSSPHRPLSHEQLQHNSLSGNIRLTLGSSVRLFSSPYSVYEIWKLRTSPQTPILQNMWVYPQWLLAYQQQQQVYVQHLSSTDYHILKLLSDGDCIEDVLEKTLKPYPDLSPQSVSNLFALLSQADLITGIAIRSPGNPSPRREHSE